MRRINPVRPGVVFPHQHMLFVFLWVGTFGKLWYIFVTIAKFSFLKYSNVKGYLRWFINLGKGDMQRTLPSFGPRCLFDNRAALELHSTKIACFKTVAHLCLQGHILEFIPMGWLFLSFLALLLSTSSAIMRDWRLGGEAPGSPISFFWTQGNLLSQPLSGSLVLPH